MDKIKLFCIPHAGGSSIAYAKWKKYLKSNIELVLVELKGRGRRMSEKNYTCLNEAIDDVKNFIKNNVKESDEYIIYGHSMGATIAYEVCSELMEDDFKKPLHLFLSGRHCPDVDKKEEAIYNLNDTEFKNAILALGGTPEEVFTNEKFREIFVPVIRSDYKNIETFNYVHKDYILPINLTVLNGEEDNLTQEEILGWSKHTSKEFNSFMIPGGHFFLYESPKKVVDVINNVC